MKKRTEFLLFDSLTDLAAFEFLALAIGERVKKFMSKRIQYSDEPIDEIRLVVDFLPSPEELALKKRNTKVTIALSSESVTYFKDVAKEHHMQYQKIIRELLDEYVAHQKGAGKK